MFDSIASALRYLKSVLYEWTHIGSTLSSRLKKIEQLIEVEKSTAQLNTPTKQERIGKLILAKAQTQERMKEYQSFMAKLGPFQSYFTDNTVGVFPIFIVTGAVGLASALYIFLEKVKNEGKALDLIQAGALKPSEARALLTGGGLSETLGNASTLLMLAGGVYLLFLFGPMLKKGTS